MNPTLVGGIVALVMALLFLSVVLNKIRDVPLWIVFLIGIALMVANLVEALRQGEDQT